MAQSNAARSAPVCPPDLIVICGFDVILFPVALFLGISANNFFLIIPKKELTDGRKFRIYTALMPVEVKVKKGEPVERALRRLKKRLDREGVIRDVRAKRYFEKPSVAKRRQVKMAVFNNFVRLKYER